MRMPPAGRSVAGDERDRTGVTATPRSRQHPHQRPPRSSARGRRSQAQSDSGWLPAMCGPSIGGTIAWRARASCALHLDQRVGGAVLDPAVAISAGRLVALQLVTRRMLATRMLKRGGTTR